MKKQNFVFISILIISLSLLLGARVWYDSKCAKFQDENMELQTLYLLDTRRGRVLKKELAQIESCLLYTSIPADSQDILHPYQ